MRKGSTYRITPLERKAPKATETNLGDNRTTSKKSGDTQALIMEFVDSFLVRYHKACLFKIQLFCLENRVENEGSIIDLFNLTN